MLFDLRGRGRQRTIRVIYVFLALLMGGGLVFFGIGGSVSGGLLDAFKNGGGGSGSGTTFTKRVQTLEKRTTANPSDASAWAELAKLRYQEAGTGANYDN